MSEKNREIKDEEIILVISKYLSDNGYAKTDKLFRKENALRKIDYGEMNYIKDLKFIFNDYIRLKTKELASNEMSTNISISSGPEIERIFRNFEVLLSDYCSYRKIIENQLGRLSDNFNMDQPPHIDLSSLSLPQPELVSLTPCDSIGDQSTTPDLVSLNDFELPMEQYLHLYRTLPNILPDVINDNLNRNQIINDSTIDSIMTTLEKNYMLSDMITPEKTDDVLDSNDTPVQARRTQRKGSPVSKENNNSTFVSKRSKNT